MKSERTFKREIKKLREFIDGKTDPVAARVAWPVEQALRRMTEKVVGWPTIVEDCIGTARLIEQDLTAQKMKPAKKV